MEMLLSEKWAQERRAKAAAKVAAAALGAKPAADPAEKKAARRTKRTNIRRAFAHAKREARELEAFGKSWRSAAKILFNAIQQFVGPVEAGAPEERARALAARLEAVSEKMEVARRRRQGEPREAECAVVGGAA